MPKLICKCNNTIDLSGIPCEHQFLFTSDVEYDKFKGEINVEDLYAQMKIFIECSNCGRLHVFWNGFDNLPKTYSEDM